MPALKIPAIAVAAGAAVLTLLPLRAVAQSPGPRPAPAPAPEPRPRPAPPSPRPAPPPAPAPGAAAPAARPDKPARARPARAGARKARPATRKTRKKACPLKSEDRPAPPKVDPRKKWRILFYTMAGIAAASMLGSAAMYRAAQRAEGRRDRHLLWVFSQDPSATWALEPNACKLTSDARTKDLCRKARNYKNSATQMLAFGGVMGVGALITTYWAFVREDKKEKPKAQKKRTAARKRAWLNRVAVDSHVGPDGAAVSVKIRF